MDSNTIFDIFRNFRSLTKFGTLGRLVIAEVLLKIQEDTKLFLENNVFVNQRIKNIGNIRTCVYQVFEIPEC